MSAMSLDEIINQREQVNARRAERKEKLERTRGRSTVDAPRKSPLTKSKNKWGNDKYFELYKNKRQVGGGDSGASSARSLCRLSNIPYTVTQDDLEELFGEYRSIRVTLFHDGRGQSLGTAEVSGSLAAISRLSQDYRNVEIDGRELIVTVVNEGSNRSSGGGATHPYSRGAEPRIRRNNSSGGSGGGRRVGGGGRVGGSGGSKNAKPKKLTAEELDRELEDYMKNTQKE